MIFNNGFDIVKTHPLNDTGKSRQTNKAQIILKCAKLLNGMIYPFQDDEREFNISMFTKHSAIEILEFKVEEKKFILHGNFYAKPANLCEYTELSFSCDDIIFCWNDYAGHAWFEGWSIHEQLF